MINSIQFIEGFAKDFYPTNTLKFSKGLSVLYGPNGSGKSVALRFLKAYTSIPKAGWSKIVDPAELAPMKFPHCYSAFTPDKDKAIVHWDGTPCFYNAGDISNSQTWFFQNVGQSDDGITTEKEQFENMVEKPSSGQFRLQKINKILSIIGNTPSLLNVPPHIHNQREAQIQCEYFKSLAREGRVTLLLDEPERSLSLPKQKKLLEVLLEFSQDYQIIVACHSPFVLSLPRDKVNIIDIQEGYSKECRELFNLSFAK